MFSMKEQSFFMICSDHLYHHFPLQKSLLYGYEYQVHTTQFALIIQSGHALITLNKTFWMKVWKKWLCNRTIFIGTYLNVCEQAHLCKSYNASLWDKPQISDFSSPRNVIIAQPLFLSCNNSFSILTWLLCVFFLFPADHTQTWIGNIH